MEGDFLEIMKLNFFFNKIFLLKKLVEKKKEENKVLKIYKYSSQIYLI